MGGLLPHLGRTLRAARTNAARTQLDIATRAGTSNATISRLETGQRWPLDPDIDAIVHAYAHELNTTAAELWLAAADAFLST